MSSAPTPLSKGPVTQYTTGLSARLAARGNTISVTSGISPSYIQANLLILPSKYASDFRDLCQRNPAPCPLLAESITPGNFSTFKSYIPGVSDAAIASQLDIRTDIPKYNIYIDGILSKSHCADVLDEWTDDHVAFLIGCSYSFEAALTAKNLPPRHTVQGRNVPMYRTSIPLCPAGIFTNSTMVVSMRPYQAEDVVAVRDITRPFGATHGEPVGWGWDGAETLGIKDVPKPHWGDAPLDMDQGSDKNGLVPVFWACGVTPQEAVMKAKIPGVVMGHAPGHMLVMDVRDWDVGGERDE